MATLLETIYQDFYSNNTSYRDIFSYIKTSSSNDKEKHDAILDLQAQVSSGIHFSGLVQLNLLNQHIMDSDLYKQATRKTK